MKIPACAGIFMYGTASDKPGSVVETTDDHLSGMRIAPHLERHFRVNADTALHSRKDLAVSPPRLPGELIRGGCPFLSVRDVSARTSRLAADRRYLLRGSLVRGECPDFPPVV